MDYHVLKVINILYLGIACTLVGLQGGDGMLRLPIEPPSDDNYIYLLHLTTGNSFAAVRRNWSAKAPFRSASPLPCDLGRQRADGNVLNGNEDVAVRLAESGRQRPLPSNQTLPCATRLCRALWRCRRPSFCAERRSLPSAGRLCRAPRIAERWDVAVHPNIAVRPPLFQIGRAHV